MTTTGSFNHHEPSPPQRPRWWRSFGAAAILAAVLGLISLILAPIIYVVGMISVIGIPLAIAAVIFPALCLAVVIAYGVYRLKPEQTSFSIARSFMFAFVIMLVLPLLYNLHVKSAVNDLTSRDEAAAVDPLRPDETLAVLRRSRYSLKCFNTCIDLLLTGQIAAYVTASLPRGSTEPVGEVKAMMHRLVRAESCDNKLLIPRNRSYNENKPGTVAYSLKAAADQGM